MRKALLFVFMLTTMFSFTAMSQQGQVSLIGEFNEWAGDWNMTRDAENPNMWSTYITLFESPEPVNDTADVKFRLDGDWAVNWGDAAFPSGIGTMGGANIPAPVGNYYVTFEFNPADSTGAYNFQRTSGDISMIGEFNGWADDYTMMRNITNPDKWTAGITVVESDDSDSSGFVDMKFRENGDWAVNWGETAFPTGVGVHNGPNIPVPYGSYFVSFEWLTDTTANYNFQKTSGVVSMIGEFNEWAGDYPMMRDPVDPNKWTTIWTIANDTEDDILDTTQLKFRQNADWGTNWGGDAFPSGTGVHNGPNIYVPHDTVGLTTDYFVTFIWTSDTTCEYSFIPTSGPISIIGAFNDWNGDVMMNRDPQNPDLFKLTRSWFEDSEIKFRENMDWTLNWGGDFWPSGTGEENSSINIPLVAGTYDVTFDYSTKNFAFTENSDVCGEILLFIYFDEEPTQVNMLRDPMYPSQFSIEYNFTSAAPMFFKMDDGLEIAADNVWGGTLPCGTGVHDLAAIFNVPGGKYNITFNCKSADFCFERLGNAVIANEVFAINVDGILDDSDWNLDQNISRIVDGTATDDVNTVDFGVTWNDTYLYIGMNITDAFLMPNESGELFVDGDKSGGAYDAHDIHVKFSGAGIEVIQGPVGIVVELGFVITASGYASEVAIPWADLGVTPEEGGQIGFDIIINDDDNGTAVDYSMAWNGDLNNYTTTNGFGDLVFGGLSCGVISMFNETIGDVVLQTPTDMPTTYVGTYTLDDGLELVFRKDKQGTVTWSTDAWPTGTATLGGPAIPGVAGSYRITFDCLTGEFNFDAEGIVPAEGIAMTDYTETAPTIDGDLGEYNLQYGSDLLVVGTGPNNNTVTWGSMWDRDNLYIAVNVVDAVVEGTGNPWDNDAIEMYIDGNNDKDGAYDSDFDTQLIMDALSNGEYPDTLWVKADGVPVTNYDAYWLATGDGYAIELRLGWDNFSFSPGKNRVMGWSIGNNDSDLGIGREYQTVWYGTGSNWSNTGDLGDLKLAGGPYFFTDGFDEDVLYNANVILYPNPTTGDVTLQTIDNVFNGEVSIFIADISGRIVIQTEENMSGLTTVQLNTNNLNRGIYFVNVMGQDGKRAVKKLIVQ